MTERFDVRVPYDATEAIVAALKKRELYSPDLLYRVFTLEDDGLSSRIKSVLRKGTDRTSDELSGSNKDGRFNLKEGDDIKLAERGRPLKPSEYLWLTNESDLYGQLSDAPPAGNLFVSVYDGKLVVGVSHDGICYEFKDKEKPQDALIALIRLHFTCAPPLA